MSLYATCVCGLPEGSSVHLRTDCPHYGDVVTSPDTPLEAALEASSRQEERLSGMRELLAKATVISAYSISDPLAVRIVFGCDEDRAAFADAIDAALEPTHAKEQG